jgi:hypothetical protein
MSKMLFAGIVERTIQSQAMLGTAAALPIYLYLSDKRASDYIASQVHMANHATAAANRYSKFLACRQIAIRPCYRVSWHISYHLP